MFASTLFKSPGISKTQPESSAVEKPQLLQVGLIFDFSYDKQRFLAEWFCSRYSKSVVAAPCGQSFQNTHTRTHTEEGISFAPESHDLSQQPTIPAVPSADADSARSCSRSEFRSLTSSAPLSGRLSGSGDDLECHRKMMLATDSNGDLRACRARAFHV